MMPNNSDEEWSTSIGNTDYSCRMTGETIAYGDAVVAVSVMVATKDSHNNFVPNFAVTPQRDDLLWEPQFFSVTGWDSVDEDLEAAELPHIPAVGDCPCFCTYCHSGVLDKEVFVLLTFGEIHRSQRMPNGRGFGSSTFQAMDNSPKILCLGCALYMHKNIVEIWEESVQQYNECEDGIIGRCWRQGCKATLANCDCSRANVETTMGR